MKKIIKYSICLLLIFCVLGCKEKRIVLNIIKVDNETNKKEVYKSYDIRNGDLLKISDSDINVCNKINDIEILDIKDNYVKISRNKVKYDTNNLTKTYTEGVIEKIKINKKFSISINEPNPLAGACSKGRYDYYLIFKKV